MSQVDIIIPVYNEALDVVEGTIGSIARHFAGSLGHQVRLLVVNDGSDPSYGLEAIAADPRVLYLSHESNRGYGQALKTGILAGDGDWIAILDADGTYPVEDLVKLFRAMEGHDMVIGVRTGEVREIPFLRRIPKAVLNTYASYMAGRSIVDLNSGMRIFSRRLAYYLWALFPSGFSFTSTLTMGAMLGGFRVREVPINYHKRVGSSSIHPVKDTVRFFRLVGRLGLIFSPKKVFYPLAFVLIAAGLVKGLAIDYARLGYIGNLALICILSGVQVFMMGLLAQLVVLSRAINLEQKPSGERPVWKGVGDETPPMEESSPAEGVESLR